MLRHVDPNEAPLEIHSLPGIQSLTKPTPQYGTWAIVVEVPAVLPGLFLLITSINVPNRLSQQTRGANRESQKTN